MIIKKYKRALSANSIPTTVELGNTGKPTSGELEKTAKIEKLFKAATQIFSPPPTY